MLTFRWHNVLQIEPERTYVALLGFVRLQSISLLPTFVRRGVLIERQLRRSPGAVGYRTAASPHNMTFYHLSAWIDGESIQQFVSTGAHEISFRELYGRLGKTVFRYWEVKGAELPLRLTRELLQTETREHAIQ